MKGIKGILTKAAKDGLLDVRELILGNAQVGEGGEALVRAFIDAGIDVNAHDQDGETALMHAASCNNSEVAFALIEAGADVNARDKNGRVALVHAVVFDHLAVSQVLIAAGADVDVQDESGCTALMRAVSGHDDSQLTRVLIDAGADVNKSNADGWTPLMWEACGGCLERVDRWIALGADVNVVDRQGRTALDLARKQGHQAVVELIHSRQVHNELLALETSGDAP